MKFIHILFFPLLLVGCVKPPPPKTDVWIEKQVYDFMNSHTNWNDDDEKVRDEITEVFKVQAVAWTREPNYLDQMPFEATNVRDTLIGNYKFILATFSTYHDQSRPKSSLLNHIHLKINAIFRLPEFAENLKLGNRYYLNGVIYQRGKRATVSIVKRNKLAIFNLGVHAFSIEQLIPIKNEGVPSNSI